MEMTTSPTRRGSTAQPSINSSKVMRTPLGAGADEPRTIRYQPVSLDASTTSATSASYETAEQGGEACSSTAALTPHHEISSENASSASSSSSLLAAAFGMLGLLNNSPYVIMLAAAKNMSEGGVALVYMANILPGLLVKVSLPYWMDKVSYQRRLAVAASAMAVAFFLVGSFSERTTSTTTTGHLYGQLLGVALISFQCSLGEASLLALAGKYNAVDVGADAGVGSGSSKKEGRLLTMFSSGIRNFTRRMERQNSMTSTTANTNDPT